MKGKKDCYNKGGKVKESKAEEHKEEKKEKAKEKKDHFNKGGAVAHKAGGEHTKKRADKRARGGKISTPTSPTSGAMPSGLPGAGSKSENN